MHPFRRVLVVLAAALIATPAASAATRLLRFPDICGDQVVFTYAGDLWRVSAQGGTAIRLTAGPGVEQSARFSPDCSRIAFTGQYGGDDQVFVIPAGGGEPLQLTWYPGKGPLPQRWGFDHQVYGWTPDGSAVLFRSWRDSVNESSPRLYTVPVAGGLPSVLPMPSAGSGRYSPDGGKLVYSPKYRDFRTWARYVGGWAQDLYIYDFAAKSATNITNDVNTDRDPVWIGDAVYFLSDRSGHLNLYRYDTAGGQTSQLTHYQDVDARWASGDAAGQLVFEVAGALHVYDARAGQDRALEIEVPSDRVSTRARDESVAEHIEDFDLSGNGKRILFTARGELFSAPAKDGLTENLTHTPGAHEREAAWGPQGKRIAYVSDQSGEEAIWVRDADGANARQLTQDRLGRLYAPRWSPDGSRIAFSDSSNNLRVVAAGGGPAPVIAHDHGIQRRDYAWSPGGHYLAYTLTDPDTLRPRLYLHDFASAKGIETGAAPFDAYAPAFSPDGKYLYFIGNREWAPQLSNIEWDFAANRDAVIFALALRKGVENPFAPRNDLASGGEDKEDTDKDKTAGKARQPGDIDDRIDFDGLAGRLVRVPIDADNIAWIGITGQSILYVTHDAAYYGRDGAFKPKLQAWSFKERKAKEVYAGLDGLALAADGESVVVRDGKEFKRIDLGADKPEPKAVSTKGLFMHVDPKAEYAEIFREVWRRYRDYFYAPNMNGYDWNALREKYAPLLADVGDRSDLNYLLGQLVAELSNSHTYVDGGDLGLPDKPHVALLGARFEADAASGRYRIARILAGDEGEKRYRSPLTTLGVNVKAGDYLLAINGQSLTTADNPYRLLRIAADQPVQLRVGSSASGADARTVLIEPIDDEMPLNYLAWVRHNREYVASASEGRIGYLHIPDMGADGIREFIKWYYPQLRKQGLVVDVRDNGGGNVSAMIIERLSRQLLGLDYGRNLDITGTYPQQTFLGHLAALCNGTTASDGDIFSYMFKQAKLGPLIGTRTWGGVVGITDWGPLIDGGNVFVPEFASADTQGNYVVEGHGVDPDIVVEQDVAAQLAGKDPQLDRAIQELEKAIEAKPFVMPPRPPDPVKAPPAMRAGQGG